MGKQEESLIKYTSLFFVRLRKDHWRSFGMLCLSVFVCLLLYTLSLCTGCDDVERYDVLTFFFDGVPSLDKKFEAVISTLPGEIANEGESSVVSVEDQNRSRFLSQKRGSSHQPSRECTKCHEGSMRSGRRRLNKPIPELCYSCHESHVPSGGSVHGPVGVGECLFCHESHQSGYIHLLKGAQPELCHRCHERNTMGSIGGHDDMSQTICTDCHDPHTGSTITPVSPFEESVTDPNTLTSSEESEDPNTVILSSLVL